MQIEIAVALIGLGGSAVGSFIGVLINTRLSNYRIEQLEKKVEKHNNYIERTFKLEQNQAVMQEELKVEQHRMDDVEDGLEKVNERILKLSRRT